jgi:DNA-binding NarL/FixJ family response regulator
LQSAVPAESRPTLRSLWKARESERGFSLTRVLIVNDHEPVRHSVRSSLSARSGFELYGEAVDRQEAVDKARQLKPDVVIMDIATPNLSGFDATSMIRNICRDTGVLILGQDESPETIRGSFRADTLGIRRKIKYCRAAEVCGESR